MSTARRGFLVGLTLLALQTSLSAAPVSWNTNSSGNWNVPGNWSPGLPTASDDVTINRPAATPTISLVGADNITVRSLANAEILTTAGGQLTLTNGASTSTGTLNHNGISNDVGYINVTGAGTTFTATGTVSLGGGSLYTGSGGVMTMTGATSASGSGTGETQFWAQGASSVTDLNNVTTLNGGTSGWKLYVLAETGGFVDLDSVGTISTGATWFEARTGSSIELTALTSFSRTPAGNAASGLWARGGTLLTPNLTTASNIFFQVDGAGVIDTADINSANGSSFYTTTAGQLTMPALTSYSGGATFEAQIWSQGAGSKTDLNNVTSLSGGTGGWTVYVKADTGGFVDLDSVASISTGSVQFEAQTGSTIELTALTSFTRTPAGNAGSRLWARGGTILTPNLTTATNVILQVEGAGVLDTADINSANGTSFYTTAAGQLTMPALTSYSGSNLFEAQIWSQGASSKTDLNNVTSLSGGTSGWALAVLADTGGFVDLDSVASISTGSVQFESRTGSTIELTALTSFTRTPSGNAGSRLWARGGTILTPNLTTATNVILQVEGAGVLDTADINSANGTSFYTTAAGQLTMPVLTSYSGSNLFEAQIWSQGASSKTDLNNVTSLSGGTAGWSLSVLAESGGFVDLDSVGTISTGSVQFESRASSTIELTALTSFSRTVSGNALSRLWARGGTILTPNLTTVNSVALAVDGAGVIDTADINSATASSFYANSAGVLTMPALTTYAGSGQYQAEWIASGANSRVNLTSLTNFTGGTGGWQVFIQGTGGGVVDLNNVTTIGSGSADIRADGASSMVDLSDLATATMTGSGFMRATSGGLIKLKAGTVTTTNLNVELNPAGTIQVGTLAMGASSRLTGTGTLSGSLNNTGGTIEPNYGSAGTQTISGTFTQGTAGTYQVQLNGTTPGTQFDQLNVTGAATLGGSVALNRLFVPAFGSTYRILTAASVAQYFTGLTNYNDSGTAHWIFALFYTPTAVDLKVVLAGDANGDGIVSGADYTIFADHYNALGGGYANGDFNSDGIVSGADYTIWADNYNATAPPPSMPVPEPASWALAVAALAAAVLTRRRNRG